MFDETDLKIISLLQENPSLRQEEIASASGLTQSSVSIRLEKIKSQGIFQITAGFDLSKVKAPIYMVAVDTEDISGVLKWAETSRNFVNAFLTSGGYPLTMIFIAEDIHIFSNQVE